MQQPDLSMALPFTVSLLSSSPFTKSAQRKQGTAETKALRQRPTNKKKKENSSRGRCLANVREGIVLTFHYSGCSVRSHVPPLLYYGGKTTPSPLFPSLNRGRSVTWALPWRG